MNFIFHTMEKMEEEKKVSSKEKMVKLWIDLNFEQDFTAEQMRKVNLMIDEFVDELESTLELTKRFDVDFESLSNELKEVIFNI